MNVTKAPKSPLTRKSVDFVLGRRSPAGQNFVSSHQIAHCPPSPSATKNSPPVELEVVLLGASKVGKTAIARQFLWRQFTSAYKETIEDFNWIEYECENSSAEPADQHHSSAHPQTFMLKLIDTSGSHEFLAMRDLCVKKAHAFILVHSVDLPQSFDEAKRLRSLIDELNVKNAQVILVTNKIDLLAEAAPCSSSSLNADCMASTIKSVTINRNEIGEFAMLNNCTALEASAKDYASVEKIFRQILQHTPYAKTVQNRLKKRRQSMPVDVLESPSSSSEANGRGQRQSPSPRSGSRCNGAAASPSPSSSLANLLGQATGGRGSLPLIKSRKGGVGGGGGHSTPPTSARLDHHQKNACAIS